MKVGTRAKMITSGIVVACACCCIILGFYLHLRRCFLVASTGFISLITFALLGFVYCTNWTIKAERRDAIITPLMVGAFVCCILLALYLDSQNVSFVLVLIPLIIATVITYFLFYIKDLFEKAAEDERESYNRMIKKQRALAQAIADRWRERGEVY